MDLTQFIGWLAPILSTIIVTAATASINVKLSESHAATERKREREVEWCRRIEADLTNQGKNIDHLMTLHASSMRSDLIHRAHRYVDDLGCASTEEKQAFHAQYKEYCKLCEKMKIKNEFIDGLVEQVMNLPNRPTKDE